MPVIKLGGIFYFILSDTKNFLSRFEQGIKFAKQKIPHFLRDFFVGDRSESFRYHATSL
jgi:hypothetical protein